LLGFCDRECRLCFAVALWNGSDPILKERLFGLTGPEGNHGEDVKEIYYYIDATPTYSYAKALYKYPIAAYPYGRIIQENAARTVFDREFEIEDTGVFDDDNYFDVVAEYAKNAPDDILIRLTLTNRSASVAPLHVLPTLWFRNTWVWGCDHDGCTTKPSMRPQPDGSVRCVHPTLGRFRFAFEGDPCAILFTENEVGGRGGGECQPKVT
jgi:hypothetical protein